MLDVHPPHAPTHTWRDFFVHIATIVVGLLIAVGLEQLVERVHQHYQLRELREALDREREANRRDIEKDVGDWRWEMVELQNDLMVLRFISQHPRAVQDDLPGDLFFVQAPVLVEAGVWDSAEQKGTLSLMPAEETNHNAIMYQFLKGMAGQGQEAYAAFNDAGSFDVNDGNPTHLTPARLDQTIERVQTAIQRLITVGYSLSYMHNYYPELGSNLTYEEVDLAHHYPIRETPAEVTHAHRLTVDRLAAAGMTQQMIQKMIAAPAKQ